MHKSIARPLTLLLALVAVPVANGWAQDWPFEAKSDTVCIGTPADTITIPTERVRAGSHPDSLRADSLLGPGYVEIKESTAVRFTLGSGRRGVEVVLRKPPCPEDPTREIRTALYEISEDNLRIIRGIAVVDGDDFNVRLGDKPVSVGSRVSFFVDDSTGLYLFYLRKGEVRALDKTFKDRGQLAIFRETWEPIAPDSVQAAWFKDFTDHSLGRLWHEEPLWRKPLFIGGAVAFVGVVTCVLVCDFNGKKRPTTGGITIPLPNP